METENKGREHRGVHHPLVSDDCMEFIAVKKGHHRGCPQMILL